MKEIYSLLSEAFLVSKNVSGKLEILGNTKKNWILFRFTFNNPEQVAPVIVKIRAGKSVYEYICSVNNSSVTVSSALFEPEFLLTEQFILKSVEPLVLDGRE